jgi:hypothetical protein
MAELAAILSALGVGGLIGAWLRGAHERRERFRDRLLDVADEFLTRVDTALRATTQAGVYAGVDTLREKSLPPKIAEALGAIDAAGALVPRLTIIFPPPRDGKDATVLAGAILEAVRAFVDQLHANPFDRDAFANKLENAGAAMREFADFTNSVVQHPRLGRPLAITSVARESWREGRRLARRDGKAG